MPAHNAHVRIIPHGTKWYRTALPGATAGTVPNCTALHRLLWAVVA